MSSNEELYVGAYLELPKLEEQIVVDVRVCPNGHVPEKHGDYCPKCGGKYMNEKIAKSVSMHHREILNEDDIFIELDHLYNEDFKDKTILIGNNTSDNMNRVLKQGDGCIEITEENSKKRMELFKIRYGSYITMLEVAFGADNVKIKFGCVIYWN